MLSGGWGWIVQSLVGGADTASVDLSGWVLMLASVDLSGWG